MATYTETRASWERRPTWELTNMVKALKIMRWRNTPQEEARLAIAQAILKDRRKAARAARVQCPDCGKVIKPGRAWTLMGVGGRTVCAPCFSKGMDVVIAKVDAELAGK